MSAMSRGRGLRGILGLGENRLSMQSSRDTRAGSGTVGNVVADSLRGSENNAFEPPNTLSRRAQIVSAMDGLQRFKQSWVSVMLLKAGIGLGQVIVLLILLILSDVLPSPIYPSQKQFEPSDQCSQPHLFQAWMGIQICRLTICWGISVWMLVRGEQRRRRRRRAQEEEEQMEEESSDNAQANLPGFESEHDRRVVSGLASEATTMPRRAPSNGSHHRRSLHPTDSTTQLRAPSLSHSTSSTSTTTLAALHNHPATPATPPYHHPGASSRIDLTRIIEMEHLSFDREADTARSSVEVTEKKVMPTTGVIALSMIPAALSEAPGDTQVKRRESGEQRRSVRISTDEPGVSGDAVPMERTIRNQRSMRSLRQARDLHNGEIVSITAEDGCPARSTGLAQWLDKCSIKISRALGGISFILFILGNILLFYPPPPASCYSASPLLWWGVATVTAVGWILLIQVFTVVVIVGLGGAVVLNALRRLGVMPAPPEPEPPRPPQPDPLTAEEIATLKVVCFVPEKAVSSETTEPSNSPSPTQAPSVYDPSRLPYPPVYLPPHKTTCAICQENFEPPKEGRTILLKADRLRLLGCGHVYHIDCIDEWLLKGSGNCPFCNQPVRGEPPAAATASASTPPTGSGSTRSRWLSRRATPSNPV